MIQVISNRIKPSRGCDMGTLEMCLFSLQHLISNTNCMSFLQGWARILKTLQWAHACSAFPRHDARMAVQLFEHGNMCFRKLQIQECSCAVRTRSRLKLTRLPARPLCWVGVREGNGSHYRNVPCKGPLVPGEKYLCMRRGWQSVLGVLMSMIVIGTVDEGCFSWDCRRGLLQLSHEHCMLEGCAGAFALRGGVQAAPETRLMHLQPMCQEVLICVLHCLGRIVSAVGELPRAFCTYVHDDMARNPLGRVQSGLAL